MDGRVKCFCNDHGVPCVEDASHLNGMGQYVRVGHYQMSERVLAMLHEIASRLPDSEDPDEPRYECRMPLPDTGRGFVGFRRETP